MFSDDFIYQVARIRAIEKKLIDNPKMDSIVMANTPEEIYKILQEIEYGNLSGEGFGSDRYPKIFEDERKKLYKLFGELVPHTEVFDIFKINFDYQNAKIILKGELTGLDSYRELLTVHGTISPDYLRQMIIERNLTDIHTIMREAIIKCLEISKDTKDISEIDTVLDRANYSHTTEIAHKSKNDFAKKMVATTIDLNNIKLLFRKRRLNKSYDSLQQILLEGGDINIKVFLDCIEASPEEIEQQFQNTAYQNIVKVILEKPKDDKSMWMLEKLSDDYIINFIRETKYYCAGVEPLMSYLIAKENEIKNIRMILIGKINGIAPFNIRERLRISYV